MKRIITILCAMVLAGVLGVACSGVDELGQGSSKNNYYWSGGKKIRLEIDYSTMIVGFDSKEQATAFVETMPKEASLFRETTVWVYVSNDKVKQKVLADKSATNKIYGHKFSGYETPFRMTGDIIMQPKAGVSVQDILSRFNVNGEIVYTTDTGIVVVMLKNWNNILSTANSIYESGMVDWCHPDFLIPIEFN